jgi:hypothetical protein
MTEVLEQVGDEAAEILAALGELLEEAERARGVAVDDLVADESWSSVDSASR